MPSLPRFAVVVALGVSALVLTGCAPDDHVLSPTNAVPTGEGTFAPDDDPVNGTVGINCQQLIDDQVIYDWGSGNFAIDVDYAPPAGSAAAQIVTDGGLACSWVNLTSSETVSVAVAAPASSALEAAREAAAAGTPAPTISPDAFFNDGRVDAFTDRYWLSAESTWFASAEDAAPLIIAALESLA